MRGQRPCRGPAPRPRKGSKKYFDYPSPAFILLGTMHYPQVWLHPKTQVGLGELPLSSPVDKERAMAGCQGVEPETTQWELHPGLQMPQHTAVLL